MAGCINTRSTSWVLVIFVERCLFSYVLCFTVHCYMQRRYEERGGHEFESELKPHQRPHLHPEEGQARSWRPGEGNG